MARERVTDEWSIPDDLWAAIAELIPQRVNTHPFGGGKPPTPDRTCMEAILFHLRTGCPCKALNATRFCPGSTAHDRFQRRVKEGVFLAMWEAGLMAYDDWQGIDWSWLALDGCMTKAPLGGEKDGEEFGFTAHIQARGEEAQALKKEAGHKARRWVVERTHSWMNRFRGVLIRWSKKAENYIALLHMCFAFIIYKRMGLSGYALTTGSWAMRMPWSRSATG